MKYAGFKRNSIDLLPVSFVVINNLLVGTNWAYQNIFIISNGEMLVDQIVILCNDKTENNGNCIY